MTSLEFSEHWKRKRMHRRDIDDSLLSLVLTRGRRARDDRWRGVFNSSLRVPPSGRTLKVVFRVTGRRTYRVITAYWLD